VFAHCSNFIILLGAKLKTFFVSKLKYFSVSKRFFYDFYRQSMMSNMFASSLYLQAKYIERLKNIRSTLEHSDFFHSHEVSHAFFPRFLLLKRFIFSVI